VKTIAQKHGKDATFMPKPFWGINGSGCHVHQSLIDLEEGGNVFSDPEMPEGLSETAVHYIGGILNHAKGMSLVVAPLAYLRIAASDRVRRGEVTSLGRFYSGLSFGWQAHPLVTVSSAILINWLDGSALLQPAAEWSASNSIVVQLGGIIGLGPGLDDDGQLQSEYGFVPFTLWGAFKVYF
jgi:hypothetical protein